MKPALPQARFWAACLVFLLLLSWMVSGVLLPFAAAAVIAYLLDPSVDWVESKGGGRTFGTLLVLGLFFFLLIMIFLLLAPLLQAQIKQLIDTLPDYTTRLQETVTPMIDRFLASLSEEQLERLRNAAGNYAGDLVSWVGYVFSSILSHGLALFDILSLMFITPIVAFYMLRDWDAIVDRLDRWLPRAHAATIREQARQVDLTLHGFIRGQASVCLILGVFYAVSMTLVGLDFALIIGLLSGILSFIPYVGSLVGFVTSTGLAAVQFGDVFMIGLVAAIFLFGQAVEGNFLQPKLVGDSVNLHPVWVMFALLAAGNLFGFLGVLIAVPAAAVLGVLTRFALSVYLKSRYFQEVRADPPALESPPRGVPSERPQNDGAQPQGAQPQGSQA